MVGDLAVLNTPHVDRLEMNLAMSWSDSKKRPLMSAVVRLVRSHSIAISKLPMDLRMKVRERNTKMGVEFLYTGFVGCGPRCGVWSMKSSAKSSSKTSNLPSTWTSTVFRRTTAFAASEELTLLIVLV